MARYTSPSTLFLGTLESVPFTHADLELPEEPGVYFVATKTRKSIIYVGQSQNMRLRWKDGHHRALECLRHGADRIYYQLTEEPYDLEQLYIQDFRPTLNRTGMG